MSPTRTASKRSKTGSSRRGGRSVKMAVDTRYAQARRRELAVAQRHDWHDWLIPSGVVGFLATITAYHHGVLFGIVHSWL
ncbi:hypothetical protein [Solimonas terrae]|uniref:Uncharacterized protein n=1 Tax=Solimonas terrae TaxID=1396819 RepID=A0A6M2BM38_9GAMM|nr:hypothetical protein [Solimonas terrae]NGY03390.1 hypothetical protein [Solimonas terrae]